MKVFVSCATCGLQDAVQWDVTARCWTGDGRWTGYGRCAGCGAPLLTPALPAPVQPMVTAIRMDPAAPVEWQGPVVYRHGTGPFFRGGIPPGRRAGGQATPNEVHGMHLERSMVRLQKLRRMARGYTRPGRRWRWQRILRAPTTPLTLEQWEAAKARFIRWGG